MSVTSGFFDSQNTDEKEDRLYGADDFGALLDGIITDGVIKSVGYAFKVVAKEGMIITVKSGSAWLDNTWTFNDGDYDLTVDSSEILTDRIDAVVIDVNKKSQYRENKVIILKGTPSSRPLPPDIVNEASHKQYVLAYISIHKKTKKITDSDIENVTGSSSFPYASSSMSSTMVVDGFDSSSSKALLSGNAGRVLNKKFGGLRLGKSGDRYGYFVGDKFYVF